MTSFERPSVAVETPELGTVRVQAVTMLPGIRFADAVGKIPDEEFSFFHDSLIPLYREMVISCVVDLAGKPVFSEREEIESLSFDTFTTLVKTLRSSMLADEPEAKKKS